MTKNLAMSPGAEIAPGVSAAMCLELCVPLESISGKWVADDESPRRWTDAVRVLENRIRTRFLVPIEALLELEYPGFAVVALDCLLLETIQSFREGQSSTPPKKDLKPGEVDMGSRAFLDRFVLQSRSVTLKTDLGPRCEDFYTNVRNKLAHDGEIHGRWLIRSDSSGKWVVKDEAEGLILNRDALHAAIADDFSGYVASLRDPDGSKDEFRKKFLKRLTAVCKGEKAK